MDILKQGWQKKASVAWLGFILLMFICLSILWGVGALRIQGDIVKLLPDFIDNPTLHTHQQQISDRLNNKVFIMLSSTDMNVLNDATQLVNQAVTDEQASEQSIWQTGVQADTDTLGQVLYAHRAGLLDMQTQSWLKDGHYAALMDSAALQMMNPALPITEQMLVEDPLMRFSAYMLAKADTLGADIVMGYPTLTQVSRSQLRWLFC